MFISASGALEVVNMLCFGWICKFRNRIFCCTFIGVLHDPNMKYELQVANPKEFYHEIHRPAHFNTFCSLDEGESVGADRENFFT